MTNGYLYCYYTLVFKEWCLYLQCELFCNSDLFVYEYPFPCQLKKKRNKTKQTTMKNAVFSHTHTHIYIYLCTYAYNNYQWLQTIIPVVIRLDDNMVTNEIFIIHTYIHITHTHTHTYAFVVCKILLHHIYIYIALFISSLVSLRTAVFAPLIANYITAN